MGKKKIWLLKVECAVFKTISILSWLTCAFRKQVNILKKNINREMANESMKVTVFWFNYDCLWHIFIPKYLFLLVQFSTNQSVNLNNVVCIKLNPTHKHECPLETDQLEPNGGTSCLGISCRGTRCINIVCSWRTLANGLQHCINFEHHIRSTSKHTLLAYCIIIRRWDDDFPRAFVFSSFVF